MTRHPYGETVIRLRGVPVTDPYSNEETTLDWSTPSELPIDFVAVAPGTPVEPILNARDSVISDFDLYFDPGADITAADRVTVRGLEYLVIGNLADWRNPFTGENPGLVLQVKRVDG